MGFTARLALYNFLKKSRRRHRIAESCVTTESNFKYSQHLYSHWPLFHLLQPICYNNYLVHRYSTTTGLTLLFFFCRLFSVMQADTDITHTPLAMIIPALKSTFSSCYATKSHPGCLVSTFALEISWTSTKICKKCWISHRMILTGIKGDHDYLLPVW